jgi:hypothetical protein
MGVKKPSLLKSYLRDFEKYIGTYYRFEVSKTKKRLDHQPSQDTESSLDRSMPRPAYGGIGGVRGHNIK